MRDIRTERMRRFALQVRFAGQNPLNLSENVVWSMLDGCPFIRRIQMKIKTLTAIVAFGGTLIMNGSAPAAYIGLVVTSQSVNLGGTVRRVFQVWACFSDPNDYLLGVFGSPTFGTMTIESRNASDTGPGSNFFNPITSHANSPSLLELNGGTDPKTGPIPPVPNAAYDTFATIGIFNQGQANPAPKSGNRRRHSFFTRLPGRLHQRRLIRHQQRRLEYARAS